MCEWIYGQICGYLPSRGSPSDPLGSLTLSRPPCPKSLQTTISTKWNHIFLPGTRIKSFWALMIFSIRRQADSGRVGRGWLYHSARVPIGISESELPRPKINFGSTPGCPAAKHDFNPIEKHLIRIKQIWWYLWQMLVRMMLMLTLKEIVQFRNSRLSCARWAWWAKI